MPTGATMMETFPRTLDKIREIESYPLVARIGLEFDDAVDRFGCDVEWIASWTAFVRAGEDESLQIKLHANLLNMLGDSVRPYRNGPDPEWRAKATGAWRRSVSETIDAMVRRACAHRVSEIEQRHLRIQLVSMIGKVVCAEQFRPKMNDMRPFETLDRVLRAGRCIAGWRGRVATGRLLVF